MAKQNLSVTEENGVLVIRIPKCDPTPSASGKSLTVASTRGNVKTDFVIDGKTVTIGLNAYIPVK